MTDSNQSLSWFEKQNEFYDVILSTRVRLVRNLADFPFVKLMSDDDKERVKSLLYDCFSSFEDFNFIDYNDLSQTGIELLKDKNIIANQKFSSVVLNNKDEGISCVINEKEHIKITSFLAGLDCEQEMKNVYKLDEYLQTKIQFAASFDFGYLTSRIKDCGSGMKITLRIFIPSIILSGQFDILTNLLRDKKCCIKPVYNLKENSDFSNYVFDIFSNNSIEGTELDQMAEIQSLGLQIVKMERKLRHDFAGNSPTIMLDLFKQNFVKAMYSLLLDYKDCVSSILSVKWGLDIGFISGISEYTLNGLLYRTKEGHLKYLCNNFNFTFEDDIKDSVKLKVKRLRAVLIQQAFEGIVNEDFLS